MKSNYIELQGRGVSRKKRIITSMKVIPAIAFVFIMISSSWSSVTASITGTDTERLGTSVASLGDMNNDGFDDLITGAPGYDSNRGAAYVFFGDVDFESLHISSTNADVKIIGANQGDDLGASLANVGDVDGDEIDDVLIGAPGASKVYLVKGTAISPGGGKIINVATDPDVITISGETSMDRFGTALSGAGDLDGDSLADVIISAKQATTQSILIDDFSDGNYISNPTWTVHSGSWSASKKYLENTVGLTSIISTPSTYTTGTWEMTFKHIPGYPSSMKWYLMYSGASNPAYNAAKGYYLLTEPGYDDIKLIRDDGSSSTTLIDSTMGTSGSSTPPSARAGSAMAYDSESDRVIHFGGHTGSYNSETHIYDTTKNVWTKLYPTSFPSGRSQHAMAYDSESDRVILFGGYNGEYLSDTWSYDYNTNTWTRMYPESFPSARRAHAMAYDSSSDRIILFGGYNAGYKSDTWAYDFNTNSWTQLFPSQSPSARAEHAMAYDSESDKVILFGGYVGYKSDTWAYDYDTNTWTQKSSTYPYCRSMHGMVYDSESDRVILFGGYSGSSYSDTWAYDYNTNTWSYKQPSTHPSARFMHAMTYDSDSDRVVLFGGNTGSYSSETWSYNYDSDRWVQPFGRGTEWTDAKVTRDASGHFEVYLDGVLKGSANDNTYTTSSYTGFINYAEGPEKGVVYVDDIKMPDIRNDAGKVYVFKGSSLTTNVNAANADAKIVGEGPADDFGHSVSEYDGSSILIGAPGRNNNAGAVYLVINVFSNPGKFRFPGEISEKFGYSVDSGNFNNDGFKDVLIGAPRCVNSLLDVAGCTYIMYGNINPSLWTKDVKIEGERQDDQFGYSVATMNDLNNDGINDFAVGAPFFDSAPPQYLDSGRVYVFFGGGVIPSDASLAEYIAGFEPEQNGGKAISTAGDPNHNFIEEVFVGAPGKLNNVECGSAVVITPWITDSDQDGLSDSLEINVIHTDPYNDDTDNDQIDDGDEINLGCQITVHVKGGPPQSIYPAFSNPLAKDSDADGLDDYEECNPGVDGFITDPSKLDTDNDGLFDSGEQYIKELRTEKRLPIPDNDVTGASSTLDNVWVGGDTLGAEANIGITHPDISELKVEIKFGNNPFELVKDFGGVSESNYIATIDLMTSFPSYNFGQGEDWTLKVTDTTSGDTGQIEFFEARLTGTTNPTDYDSDGDSIDDLEETTFGTDGWITDPRNSDTDNDGWDDLTEITEGTDPTIKDTDRDGIEDDDDIDPLHDIFVTIIVDTFSAYKSQSNNDFADPYVKVEFPYRTGTTYSAYSYSNYHSDVGSPGNPNPVSYNHRFSVDVSDDKAHPSDRVIFYAKDYDSGFDFNGDDPITIDGNLWWHDVTFDILPAGQEIQGSTTGNQYGDFWGTLTYTIEFNYMERAKTYLITPLDDSTIQTISPSEIRYIGEKRFFVMMLEVTDATSTYFEQGINSVIIPQSLIFSTKSFDTLSTASSLDGTIYEQGDFWMREISSLTANSDPVHGMLSITVDGTTADAILADVLMDPNSDTIAKTIEISEQLVTTNLPNDIISIIPYKPLVSDPSFDPNDQSYWAELWAGVVGTINVIYSGLVAIIQFMATLAINLVKWAIDTTFELANEQPLLLLQNLLNNIVKPFNDVTTQWVMDRLMSLLSSGYSDIYTLINNGMLSAATESRNIILRLAEQSPNMPMRDAITIASLNSMTRMAIIGKIQMLLLQIADKFIEPYLNYIGGIEGYTQIKNDALKYNLMGQLIPLDPPVEDIIDNIITGNMQQYLDYFSQLGTPIDPYAIAADPITNTNNWLLDVYEKIGLIESTLSISGWLQTLASSTSGSPILSQNEFALIMGGDAGMEDADQIYNILKSEWDENNLYYLRWDYDPSKQGPNGAELNSQELRDALDAIATKMNTLSDDFLFIYYSGHAGIEAGSGCTGGAQIGEPASCTPEEQIEHRGIKVRPSNVIDYKYFRDLIIQYLETPTKKYSEMGFMFATCLAGNAIPAFRSDASGQDDSTRFIASSSKGDETTYGSLLAGLNKQRVLFSQAFNTKLDGDWMGGAIIGGTYAAPIALIVLWVLFMATWYIPVANLAGPIAFSIILTVAAIYGAISASNLMGSPSFWNAIDYANRVVENGFVFTNTLVSHPRYYNRNLADSTYM